MSATVFTPPTHVTLWFCPACGKRIMRDYRLDEVREKCSGTWHKAVAVDVRYTQDAEATQRSKGQP